jgi:hypothetical protein
VRQHARAISEVPSSQRRRLGPCRDTSRKRYRRSPADNERVVQSQAMFYKVGHGQRSFGSPPLHTHYRLPMHRLVPRTVNTNCSVVTRWMGVKMTMEDLQHKIGPKVRPKVLERKQQTAKPEAHLNDASSNRDRDDPNPSPTTRSTDRWERAARVVDTSKGESLYSNSFRDYSPELWAHQPCPNLWIALYRHPPCLRHMVPGIFQIQGQIVLLPS